jgi:hypothetical protein
LLWTRMVSKKKFRKLGEGNGSFILDYELPF